jgi:hypothetical protein
VSKPYCLECQQNVPDVEHQHVVITDPITVYSSDNSHIKLDRETREILERIAFALERLAGLT